MEEESAAVGGQLQNEWHTPPTIAPVYSVVWFFFLFRFGWVVSLYAVAVDPLDYRFVCLFPFRE